MDDHLPQLNHVGPEFRFSSLRMSDRQQIVDRSGSQAAGDAFVEAALFQLSALGANMDLHGQWPLRQGSPLAEWRHVTTSGRDQYVRVVDYGYMFPFGHLAVITQVTDRILTADQINPTEYSDAYLQYQTFIRVVETSKGYPAFGQPFSGNDWPFTEVEFLTAVTPPLDSSSSEAGEGVGTTEIGTGNYPQVFWPTVGGAPFLWKLHLTDYAGTVVSVHVPVAFCYADDLSDRTPVYPVDQFSGTKLEPVAAAYNSLGAPKVPSSKVTAPVGGTAIRFAPEVTVSNRQRSGVTTHPTLQLTFGAATTTKVPAISSQGNLETLPVPSTSQPSESSLVARQQPAFYPTLLSANIRLPAAEALGRQPLDDPAGPGGVAIHFYPDYVQGGFPTSLKPAGVEHPAFTDVRPHTVPANPGSVYAGLLSPPQLNFPADMVGGVGNPNLNVNGLSAAAGAIGGQLGQYAQQAQAIVTDYFGGLTSALSSFMGGLPLGSPIPGSGLIEPHILPDTGILQNPASGAMGFANDLQVPELTQSVDPTTGVRTVTYTLHANLCDFPSSGTPVFQPTPGGTLTLTATVVITPSGATTFTVNGTMDPFSIQILGGSSSFTIIQIPFGSDSQPGLTFQASTGAKTSIQPNVGQVQFEGILSFVGALEQFLQDLGGSGLSIDVTPTQVAVSLNIALPAVGFGVFTLQNMALNAGVIVPFLGSETTATFGFCSQEQPFTLTVCCFGGGGFVTFGVGLTSIQSVTASIDFEGQFALDLVVASGGVSLTAGIIFGYTSNNGAALTGFIRVNGEVEVLGILSVSLLVEMQITYDFSSNSVTGTATMSVSVSLFCFSVSVGITVTKTFGSANAGAPIDALAPHDATVNPFATTTPTFADLIAEGAWADYCSAFAS